MQVSQAEKHKDYYIIMNYEMPCNPLMVCEENGRITGTKYIDSVKCFYHKKDAKNWISKHTYVGMTAKYTVAKITYDYKDTKRWWVIDEYIN